MTSHACPRYSSLTIHLPIATPSLANARLHWAKRARIVKQQRLAAALMVGSQAPDALKPKRITLTRMASRKLDTDNLASALKAVRDGIAVALGISDGDERIEWVYRQENGQPRGVMVEIA